MGQLVLAGKTNEEIAASVGMNKNTASFHAAKIRAALGVPSREQRAEIRRDQMRVMFEQGMSNKEIARALGMSDLSIGNLRGRLGYSRPASRLLPEERAKLEAEIMSGADPADLARRYRMTLDGILNKRRRMVGAFIPVRDCECGRPYRHRGMCQPSAQHVAKAIEFARGGMTLEDACRSAGRAYVSLRPFLKPAIEQLRAAGETCQCGAPFAHSGACRNRPVAQGRAAPETIDAIRAKLRRGVGLMRVVREEGTSRHTVTKIHRQMLREGALPVNCECGKKRGHRGICNGKALLPLGMAEGAPNLDGLSISVETRRSIYKNYRRCVPVRRMAELSGVDERTVRKLIAHWQARPDARAVVCKCGRPAYHPGGCSATNPAGMLPLQAEEISRRLLAGETLTAVADGSGISRSTARERARQAFLKLGIESPLCMCGRPLWHRGICKERKASRGLPTGASPIDPELAGAIKRELLAGTDWIKIRQSLDTSHTKVTRISKQLSKVERAQRAAAIRQRKEIASMGESSAGLLAAIKAAVPRWVEPVRRDDIANEVFLGMLGGRVPRDQLKAAIAKASRSDAAWKERGFDEPLDNTHDATLAGLIGDQSTSALVDEITIGEAE